VTIRPTRYACVVLGMALAHCLGALLCLQLTTIANTTPVWVPTGVDIALLVLLGVRVWPGVLIGDFTSNTIQGGVPHHIDFVMSCGNALAAPIAGLVSGTIGIGALYLGGLLPEFGTPLRTWFLADVTGAVAVAPLLLMLPGLRLRLPSARRAVEAAAMLAALTAVSLFAVQEDHDEAYLVFRVLVWAALRFGVRGAAFTSLLAAVVAVLGHAQHDHDGVTELLAIQGFMAVCSLTGLLLAVTSQEREAAVRSERALRSQLQAYFTHAPVALFMKDLGGRYLALNKTVAGLHGSTVDALIGKPFDHAFSPGDATTCAPPTAP
jgi:integral membrane sensor domain MASE1